MGLGAMVKFPHWIKRKVIVNTRFLEVKGLLDKFNLNTVCYWAKCPNLFECFSGGHASFLILGKICTRSCSFCGIKKGSPEKVDFEEPERIARAVQILDLKYVVITSVTRDDLTDKGSNQFYNTVVAIKKFNPKTKIEILIPDFNAKPKLLELVISSGADVISHNLETIKSLYKRVRVYSSYQRGFEVLNFLGRNSKKAFLKSSIMLGLGEEQEEVLSTIRELRLTGCDILVIGQYLKPDKNCMDVIRFVSPEEFNLFSEFAYKAGFKYVLSSPFARSSYLAKNALLKLGGKADDEGYIARTG